MVRKHLLETDVESIGLATAPGNPASGNFKLYFDDSGNLKSKNSAGDVATYATSAVEDHKFLVTSYDTTAGYLDEKLTVGTNLSKTVGTPGGNETLEIGLGSDVVIDDSVHTLTNKIYRRYFTAYGASDTMDAADDVVTYDITGAVADTTYTLLSAATVGAGRTVTIIRVDGDYDFKLIITPDGSDTINGSASLNIMTQWNSVTLVSDGTSTWYIIA